LRAARFGALLGKGPRVGFLEIAASVLLSHAANNVLPLRAGELVRTRDFVARGYSLGAVASAQVVEKAVELLTMVMWAAPVLTRDFVAQRPALWIGLSLLMVAAVGVWLARRV